MKLLLLLLAFHYGEAIKEQLYRPSENYQPIRHEEEDRNFSEKEIKIAVKKMRRIMGWKKTIDVGITVDKIETPWLNQTYWDSLAAKARWELRKAYYEKQRELDKLREERKELVVKEKEERGRLEQKFVTLIKERGKRIAFYFIEQFQNFKKKQKKKSEGRLKEPWNKPASLGRNSAKPGPSDRPALGHQPHILFILADDYGFHDIGYHMAEILTPNMDKLAKEGVILENYYVQQVCTPTRAQLMTGRYQIRYGMQHGVVRPPQPDGIPLDEKLIPDALKQCGYNTEMIGKWHLGFFQKEYCPQYRGYDHFLGFLTGSEDFYTHEKCFFGMCGYDFREAYANKPEVIRYDLNDTYSTGIFTTGLHDRLSVLDPKVPLFTYLSFQSVHSPLQAPKGFIDIYRNLKNRKRRNYNAMVTAMDKSIGEVVKSYKKFGFWENTVLIFSSDNGGNMKAGASNWPLRGAKGTLYEGGIRSIGFVHSPLLPISRMGTVSKNLMHVTDWFPTILHLAGCRNKEYGGKPLDGVSQVPALWSEIEQNYAIRNEILHSMDPLSVAKQMKDPRGNWKSDGGVLKDRGFKIQVSAALRMGKWKLITGHGGPVAGWGVPPTQFHGNATSIFDEIELPDKAYVDDVKESVKDCEETCTDAKPSRRRKRNVNWFNRSRRATDTNSFSFQPSSDGETEFILTPFNDTMSDEEAHRLLSSHRRQRSMPSIQRVIDRKEKQIAKKKANGKKKNKKKGKIGFSGYKVNLVQLFNIEEDPTEKKDISSDFPKVVNVMLTKLADYYDVQVAPRYPAYDPESDPQLGDGVWRPWIKSEDELGDFSIAEKEAYLQIAHDKFNHVDDSERRKLNLAKESASLKAEQDATPTTPVGPQIQLKMGISGKYKEPNQRLTREQREVKQLARLFFREEKEIKKEIEKSIIKVSLPVELE